MEKKKAEDGKVFVFPDLDPYLVFFRIEHFECIENTFIVLVKVKI